MYEQIKAPNLSVVGQPEMCLAYVREVFGASGEYATAAIGWQHAQYKHVGTPPSNISVPIWFTYNGPDGHVCLWNQGTLHSTSAKGMVTFPSIQALINWMGEGFEYLGWSEDVDGERVAAPVATPSGTTIEINPGTWNVRTGPGIDYAVIPAGPAEGGQKYSATIVDSWAEIEFTGKTGYVGPAAFKVV